MRYVLAAPPSYWKADDEDHNAVCNGCGAQGAKFDFVPDSIYGLPIGEACNVHDWMYMLGQSEGDRASADMVMLNNLMRLIERDKSFTGRVLRLFRRRRALKYYEAVRAFGGPAFWAGKEHDEAEQAEEATIIPVAKAAPLERIDPGPGK